MKKNQKQVILKDRTYKLKNGQKPLSFTIPSRSSRRFPLLWYDEENNVNRPLRYAVNQKSPFEDEQDDNPILAPVVFEDGLLHVPKTNPVLQEFLHYHPMNEVVFEELDHERDAQKEVEALDLEVDALIKAKELTIDQLEQVYRVIFNKDVSRVTTAEMRRDILVYAKNYPQKFISAINDPDMKMQARIHVFFDYNLLTFRSNNKEVWYNTPTNKKKMLSIPYGEDPYVLVSMYLKTDEGVEALKMLEHHMETLS
jgi:hypothetical protein